ncbi:hypothetical protein LB503_006674 [Fusarium chuoi]|nr:hypothetical protein LB503_006674 [Fusarium chuoi]
MWVLIPAIDLKLKMVLATSHNTCLLQHRKDNLDCFSWGCYFRVIDFDHGVGNRPAMANTTEIPWRDI